MPLVKPESAGDKTILASEWKYVEEVKKSSSIRQGRFTPQQIECTKAYRAALCDYLEKAPASRF